MFTEEVSLSVLTGVVMGSSGVVSGSSGVVSGYSGVVSGSVLTSVSVF
jgi:hypothetical protein